MPLVDRTVAVVGVGGLGCPAAVALCEAGTGRLRLIDPDHVETSNLPRQLLYGDADVGRAKVEIAAVRLRGIHSATHVEIHQGALTPANARELLAGADFLIDATDGVAAKLTINDYAVDSGTPFCHAGVVAFRGQLLSVLPGRTPCLRCVFPELSENDEVAACSGEGIIGPLAGMFGALQSIHALAILTGDLEIAGRLLTYDGLADRWMELDLSGAPRCGACRAVPRSAP